LEHENELLKDYGVISFGKKKVTVDDLIPIFIERIFDRFLDKTDATADKKIRTKMEQLLKAAYTTMISERNDKKKNDETRAAAATTPKTGGKTKKRKNNRKHKRFTKKY